MAAYAVELLLREPLRIGPELEQRLVERLPGSRAKSTARSLQLAHPGHNLVFTDRTIPAVTMLLAADDPPDRERITRYLDQTRDWPDAQRELASANHCALIADLLGSQLPYKTRMELFQRAAEAIVAELDPVAIVWHPAEKVVAPDAFLRTRQLAGPSCNETLFNVRMFRIQGTGDLLMDTIGFAEFGLPDVQMHFRGLDSNAVAAFLANVALYLYESGDVIVDGHTVQGLAPDHRWPCRHEQALVKPDHRVVLDIEAGPFAAGRRHPRDG